MILALFLLLFASLAQAAQSAVISVDGAMIYKSASFDAPIIAYMQKGKKVRVSSKTYGPFYKVRVRSGMIGFISDIDVEVSKSKRRSKKGQRKKRKKGSKGDTEKEEKDKSDIFAEDDTEEERPHRRKPIFATRYVGLLLNNVNYKEEIFNQELSSNELTYGVKLTGPNILLSGPLTLDLSLIFSLSAPSYYEGISSVDPSGFLFFADLNLIFPYIENDNWSLYFGAGPVIIVSNFDIAIGNQALELQELKLGGSFTVGAAYRWRKFIVKFEPKYYLEQNKYFSFLGSIQREF